MQSTGNLPIAEVLLDSVPFPVEIYRVDDGLNVIFNHAIQALWGIARETIEGKYNVLNDPQMVKIGIATIFERVRAGETVQYEPIFYDSSQLEGVEGPGKQSWVIPTYFPIRDAQGSITHVGMTYRDVTHEVAQQQSIASAHHEIESQRSVIQDLSSPMTRVWDGVLVVPIVGELDELRAVAITESLLDAIVAQQAGIVILDITGVPLVDTQVASALLKATSACKLLGSTVVLVGIGSEIAQAIVHLGVDLSGIVTRSNLQAGILWAFERLGLQVVRSAAPVGAR